MNYKIFFIALLWFCAENRYFGWNAFAQSPDELLCDGIFSILVAMSYFKVNKETK